MEEIETLASKLYKKYYEYFFTDKEASFFFYRLHLEEKGHRNLVQYVKRLARQNPTLFKDIDMPLEELNKFIVFILELLDRKKQPTLEEAVGIAEELELTLSEGYLKNLPLISSPILADLYNALGEKEHTERITAFKRTKGFI
jgi:rubrerythrin